MTLRFSIFQDSKKGGRSLNEDRMGYTFTKDALLLVVCDGMGGHYGGELAAEMAVQCLVERFQKLARPILRNPSQFLDESFLAAHRVIEYETIKRNYPESPRTTIVACVVQHGAAFWAHAGDSRLYAYRAGNLIGRTRDHSKLELLQAQGVMLGADPSQHPDRNKLYNCLGSPNDPLVEHGGPLVLKPDDCLLLCSDGLWSSVSDGAMRTALTDNNVMAGVPQLIDLALQEAGDSSDNVTAIGMNWLSDEPAKPDLPETDTLTMRKPGYASTIQTVDGTDADQGLTEEEIDAAVAEIRNAIKRSEPKS